MSDILENAEADLTPQMRNLIDLLWGEWKTVEQQIEVLRLELERISAADAGCTRIRQIPGIGPIVATAIVAAIALGGQSVVVDVWIPRGITHINRGSQSLALWGSRGRGTSSYSGAIEFDFKKENNNDNERKSLGASLERSRLALERWQGL